MFVKDLKVGYKAKIPTKGLSGNLYYCPTGKLWYILHNDNSHDGNIPHNWDAIKEKMGFKFSWQINDVGGSITTYEVVMEGVGSDFLKDEGLQNKILTKGDTLISTEFLHEKKVKVLRFGTKANGILYNKPDTGVYFMSDSLNFNGSKPPGWEEISKTYGFKYSWKVADSGRYLKDCDSIEFIDYIPEEPKKDGVFKNGDTLSKDMHLRYAKLTTNYAVAEGIIYYCPGNNFYVFLSNHKDFKGSGGPQDWGHIVNSCHFKNAHSLTFSNSNSFHASEDTILELTTGYYNLVIKPKKGEKPPTEFKVGDRVRCLTTDELYRKFGKYTFEHGGETRKYAGTIAVITDLYDTTMDVRWNVDGRKYTMLREEFKAEPNFIDNSGSFGFGSSSTTKLYIKGLEPPTSTDSFHLKEKTELDKIPSGELDTYKPKKISSDADVRGTTVPRNKDMENLILLGL